MAHTIRADADTSAALYRIRRTTTRHLAALAKLDSVPPTPTTPELEAKIRAALSPENDNES